jgi:hypothetical protein
MDLFMENLGGSAPWMTIQQATDHYNAEFAGVVHPVVDSGMTTAVESTECDDMTIVADVNNNITILNDALTF